MQIRGDPIRSGPYVTTTSISQLCLYLEIPHKALEGACAIYLMFSHFEAKTYPS